MTFTAHASSSAGNLYAVTAGGCPRLLIECGLPRRAVQRAMDFQVSELAGCLVSHHHADHASSTGYLLGAGVDCYMSAGTASALGVGGHRIHLVEPLRRFDVGPWAVLPFDVRHDADDALGFLVCSPDGDKLLYACDTAYVPYRFRGLTHIAVEANYSAEILRKRDVDVEQKKRVMRNHLSIERVVEMLAANDLSRVREIWLLHLSDGNSDENAFRDVVQRATGKPTFVALKEAARAAAS